MAGFKSERVAGFNLECMAGFIGIRTRTEIPTNRIDHRTGWHHETLQQQRSGCARALYDNDLHGSVNTAIPPRVRGN
jgi:hypothetical protein